MPERIRPIDLLEDLARQGVSTRAHLVALISRRRAELVALEALLAVLSDDAKPARQKRQAKPQQQTPAPEAEEADVVTRAQRGDAEAMAAVIADLRPAVYAAIKRANLPAPVEDLTQECNMAIIKALPRFDASRSKLQTFMTWPIRGAIKDYAREKGYFLAGGTRTKRTESVGHLDALVYDGHKPTKLLDLIADGHDSADRVEQLAAREEFSALVRGCTQQARQVIYLRFFRDLKMREIGDIIGVGESRVSQILSEELPRLRDVADRRAGRDSASVSSTEARP